MPVVVRHGTIRHNRLGERVMMEEMLSLQGNDIRLLHFPRDNLLATDGTSQHSIEIHEFSWMRGDGQVIGREHLLMALADVDYILIKATENSEATTSIG